MLDLPDLPDLVEIGLQLALIAIAALVAFVVLRAAVSIGVRHLIERRTAESGSGVLPPAELERRVNTVARLAIRVAGTAIAVIGVLMALDLFGIDIGPAVAQIVARPRQQPQRIDSPEQHCLQQSLQAHGPAPKRPMLWKFFPPGRGSATKEPTGPCHIHCTCLASNPIPRC